MKADREKGWRKGERKGKMEEGGKDGESEKEAGAPRRSSRHQVLILPLKVGSAPHSARRGCES